MWKTPNPRQTFSSRKEKGNFYEAQAEEYLKNQGFTTIARQFTALRGEIDLIMHQGKLLIFVEVRQRQSMGYGGAKASIGAKKQATLVRTAQAFLQQYPQWRDAPMRFDVIAFENQQLQWIPHAFET